MTITINSDDPRSIKAIEIASGADHWLKCRTRTDGRKVYGVPSQSAPNVYHLVDQHSCTCQDAQRHPSQACKHQLAVRLHVELVKAQQSKPRHLRLVPASAPPHGDVFGRPTPIERSSRED